MPDEPVDGFSDVPQSDDQGKGPDSADPGFEGENQPFSPDERARLEQEIKEGDQEGHHGQVQAQATYVPIVEPPPNNGNS